MAGFAALDPVSLGTSTSTQYRYRPQSGERSLLPNGPRQTADTSASQNEQREFAQDRDADQRPAPSPSTRSGASDFAAAVIAGALSPTPQSMNELIRRIGASEIPEESQARLKDLSA